MGVIAIESSVPAWVPARIVSVDNVVSIGFSDLLLVLIRLLLVASRVVAVRIVAISGVVVAGVPAGIVSIDSIVCVGIILLLLVLVGGLVLVLSGSVVAIRIVAVEVVVPR